MTMRSDLWRLAAYVLGQGIGYATDLLVFLFLVEVVHLNLTILAHLCGKFGSAALTYFYHARFSFPGMKRNSRSASTVAYTGMVLFNMIFTSAILKGVIFVFPSHVYVAKITSDVLGVIMTYFFMRTLVFPRTATE